VNTPKGGPYYQTNTDLDGADTKISPRKATPPGYDHGAALHCVRLG
jgi:hypothetical protein